MGRLGILWGDLITLRDYVILSYPCKFMNGHLYFPNNLKYIKDHIQAYMIRYKKCFQLMVTVFKENLNLQLPNIFYSSIRFVFETVFISEQIADNKFGALLEIRNKFITKFNVFNYMVLQLRLKTVQGDFWGQIYGGILYMGTNDQIRQGGKFMVKRFQNWS